MHIKEIEFQNFKSFGKKIKIPFFDGFTTISGPNGSGKSNIVDGILFCLGLSSSRTMRAEKLTDLIYNGDGGKKPDFAQVTIRFDNSDREMPVDSDQVSVTRKIRNTESGYYSYYYFNDKAVSLSDIHNYLSKAKITPEGYNVVMQGDVTRITEMTATERRKIIDEIAGVAEFDNKKERAMNELEIVRERIERVDIILAEVDVQRDKLQKERDQALKYQGLQIEKVRFEGYILLSKLNDSKKELENILNEITVCTEKDSELEASSVSKKEMIIEIESRLKKINELITRMGEEEQISVKRQIEEIKGEISLNKNTINLNDSDIEDVDAQRRKGLIEIDSIKEKITELSSMIDEETNRKEAISFDIEDQKTKLLVLRSRIAEVDSRFIQTRDELSRLKNELEYAKNNKNELMRQEDRLLDSMRRRSAEYRDMEEEIEESIRMIKSADDDREDVLREIEALGGQMKDLTKDIDDLESNRSQLKGVVKELDETLRKLQQEYMTAEARLKAAREISGYSGAVGDVLKAKQNRELPGIYGTIAQLGKVDQKYATALEVAAGGRMQSIVVDTDEDAARAISFLKRQRSGRATFLPLNKMSKPSGFRDISKMPGVIDYAIKLVDYDDRFEKAFYYVFSDTIVVENLDTARRLMGGLRMVTLDGELVEKSGAMTGGGQIRKGLSFASGEEERITKLAEQITEYDSRRNNAITKLDTVESHIAAVQKEQRELETEITRKQLSIQEINSRGERLTALIAEKKTELALIDAGQKELRKEMEVIEDKKKVVEQEIAALADGAEKLEAQLKGSEVPQLNEKARWIEDEIRRLETRQLNIEANISNLSTEYKYADNKIEDTRTRISELDGRKDGLRRKIEQLRGRIAELELSLKEKLDRENELDVELADMRRQREELNQEYGQWQKQYEDIKVKLDESRRRLMALNATRDALAEQTEEFTLELEKRGVELTDEVPTLDEVNTRIDSIGRAMSRLEPVNMRAIEEYEEVEQRSNDLRSRRDILDHEREEILERISRYELLKKQTFMECLHGINEHFVSIFYELSDGPGELMLENPDDPFSGGLTIKAQPKDKTVQRMEAMSGGEKSLTALAFIFAIQAFRPAPFYAFDEIDMFLDGANADRVAQRVKKVKENAQFIVVSLRKPMIQAAERTIGVAMQENNITSITGVKLN